eukprot:8883612-Lingulodinium_polyedra.AAC.1
MGITVPLTTYQRERPGKPSSPHFIDPVRREGEYRQTAELATALARRRAIYLAEQIDNETGRKAS